MGIKTYTLTIMKIRFYPLKLFLKRKSILITLVIGGLLNLASWIWILFGARKVGEQAVLHYTVLFGVNQIGPFWSLYTAPMIGLWILLINLIVAWIIYSYDTFLSALIMTATVYIQAVIFGTAAILVLLNG